jgi:hypothetical protein
MSRGSRKILAMLLWSMMVPETPALAQPDDSGIWGEAIMAQPFDTVPFRAVKIPEWVKETTGCGYTLSGKAPGFSHGDIRRPYVDFNQTVADDADLWYSAVGSLATRCWWLRGEGPLVKQQP